MILLGRPAGQETSTKVTALQKPFTKEKSETQKHKASCPGHLRDAEQGIKSADGQQCTKIQTQQLCTLLLSIPAIYLAELFSAQHCWASQGQRPTPERLAKADRKAAQVKQRPQRNLCPHQSSGIIQEDVGELKYQVLKSLS